ncbi:adipogenesis regulatory factor isoform X1 [Lagopus muta]|uniref:adipogenesis regulatory factor isoform X1 n=1 Tax=Lagopus muta TaxID=64668 RepID=UPI00209DEBC4|nr:adipogenesis regulatory factor isoform X1 [Lagopus muta]
MLTPSSRRLGALLYGGAAVCPAGHKRKRTTQESRTAKADPAVLPPAWQGLQQWLLLATHQELITGKLYKNSGAQSVCNGHVEMNLLSLITASALGQATQDAVSQITDAGQKAVDKACKTTQDGVEKAAGQAAEAMSGFGKKCGFKK